MAEIINFNEAKAKEEGGFAIRKDDDDLKTWEEWEGEDWKALFNGPMTYMAQTMGVSPWDMFAKFMSGILSETMPESED